jgi:carbamoyl-phosphate synthase large subunit
MPKRDDIKSVLIIGAGPIVIGQACEFDYSGTQAAKALREEGLKVILANSNPATIMTDPEFADSTYIEPLTADILEKIISLERPDALLPTVGGQTGLNLSMELAESGVLEKYGVEMIGADPEAIKRAESRERFKECMAEIGLKVPVSCIADSLASGMAGFDAVGLPAIIRPSFTLGGGGGGVARTKEEFIEKVKWGLSQSPANQVMIEQSLLGWKEFELEVMRDAKDNVVIVCSIENLDPMGVHTGDSITVAPAQTLTDREYQIMRNAAIAIIRKIDTGGSNIQFAVSPETGELMIIEMNPRVSRSSALASKATGFPIAKIAAKLAIGYTLDEIPNDITKETPASFEPTLDYCVVKIPRFAFEKFPATDMTLTPQMKSVGEVMAIGRTFKESFQKALRSLETDSYGLDDLDMSKEELGKKLETPVRERVFLIAEAFRRGWTIERIYETTGVDPWFLDQILQIVEAENGIRGKALPDSGETLLELKQLGFSDKRLAELCDCSEADVREKRIALGVRPVFKRIDTCAAEFEAQTPYLYSTYEEECEARPTEKKKIMILGGGPNRIGQGLEFDYCCVHGVFALKEAGYETIMVNCNPETVSTDYDTSDRLYFEPITLEDVMEIIHVEQPDGVIVQFGGQTPLKLCVALEKAGIPIIGTSPDAIDRAEDRKRFQEVLRALSLRQPVNDTAMSIRQAVEICGKIGYPVVVRPSYVLGGRAMETVYDEADLLRYMEEAVDVSDEHPVLIDRFLENSIEVDVDAVSDGDITVIGGVMEHIEEAGIHSGDSACSLPPRTLSKEVVDDICEQTRQLAGELGVVGLINIQFAVKGKDIYVLEVNPRASRSVPFVSKAIGIPLAKLAARVMAGEKLKDLGFTEQVTPKHVSVKESVFPFIKFPNVDLILGPEMKSTGEVMGIDTDFEHAFARAATASGSILPKSGNLFISVAERDKAEAVTIARKFDRAGFRLLATKGTAALLKAEGLEVETVKKVKEGPPHIVDKMLAQGVDIVVNTTFGKQAIKDSYSIRRTALQLGIPYATTIAGGKAFARAILSVKEGEMEAVSLQQYHADTIQR